MDRRIQTSKAMASITVTLPPDTEQRLREKADSLGMHVEAYLQQLAEKDVANAVKHGLNGGWASLAELNRPTEHPRYNAFDWESWHEATVFRAQVEQKFRERQP